MAKISFKPGNMLYPLPVVMVSVADQAGHTNIITVAWAGTVCTNPPMVSISVRPSRYSYHMIEETGEFVINLTTRALAYAADYCGVKSGRDVDKWKETGLTPEKSDIVKAPCIAQSPVNADEQYMDEKGGFHLEKANPVVYSHGGYYDLGDKLGKFGYSVKRRGAKKS